MSFFDYCEERAFEHGRSIAIEGFTVKELTTELCKREGVKHYVVAIDDYSYLAHGKKKSIKIDGSATILLVKECLKI
jgi:hypothetical protein